MLHALQKMFIKREHVVLTVACGIENTCCPELLVVLTPFFAYLLTHFSKESIKIACNKLNLNGIARIEGTSNHEQKAVSKLRQTTKMQGCEKRIVAPSKKG
jgi:hypothetical protein